jgi:nicotinamide mononucleotide (NMN) deamidase PncC
MMLEVFIMRIEDFTTCCKISIASVVTIGMLSYLFCLILSASPMFKGNMVWFEADSDSGILQVDTRKHILS